MKVSIIGTGYVGLVTGACLAEKGHSVTCVDLDPQRVAALNRAVAPIYEAGLEDLLRRHVPNRLTATTDLESAVAATELTLIAVGTPFNGREIDLTAVLAATKQVGAALRSKPGYHVVVVKSTVIPGTTDSMVRPALEQASGKRAGLDFGVGMNPEFLSEGEAVRDFLYPDRIVLGGIDERSRQTMAALYEVFDDQIPRLQTNTRTAEMIKYASNALLATLISFSNELANLGASVGEIDTVDVMEGVQLSQYFRSADARGLPQITSFLRAGCGFGGSCLPKDVAALVAQGKSLGQPVPLLESVLRINKDQPRKVVDLLRKHWPDLRGTRVAVLGLAFKPETSDVRESPAFPIMRELLDEGAVVRAHDPVANAEAAKAFPEAGVRYLDQMEEALTDVDAVIVVTPWAAFKDLRARLAQSRTLLVDARRAYSRQGAGLYEGIGL